MLLQIHVDIEELKKYLEKSFEDAEEFFNNTVHSLEDFTAIVDTEIQEIIERPAEKFACRDNEEGDEDFSKYHLEDIIENLDKVRDCVQEFIDEKTDGVIFENDVTEQE